MTSFQEKITFWTKWFEFGTHFSQSKTFEIIYAQWIELSNLNCKFSIAFQGIQFVDRTMQSLCVYAFI